jgi:hypothetical protein
MNLQYWRDPHKISRRVARQVLRLAEYDIELRHIPGKTNGRADALSRLPNYNQGGDDNEDVTVLPDHLFVRLSLTEDEERQTRRHCAHGSTLTTYERSTEYGGRKDGGW